jgi:SAM-dependent methyltransferase
MELLLGAGNSKDKRIRFKEVPDTFIELITLDIDEGTNPDVVHDLRNMPLPFDDDKFDEIHAYEVLEHCGAQGDWRLFFSQFSEFHRILKPGGFFCATVPMWDSPWAWADPGHTRVINRQTLLFLCRAEYEQVGRTAMTDYRPFYFGDFNVIGTDESEHQFGFVLKAIK